MKHAARLLVLALGCLPAAAQAPATLAIHDVTLDAPTTSWTLGHDQRFDVTCEPNELVLVLGSATPPLPGLELGGMPILIDVAAFAVLVTGAPDASGDAQIPYTVPTSLTPGNTAYLQALLADLAAPSLRLTGGVAATVATEAFTTLAAGSQSGHPLAQSSSGAAAVIDDAGAWTTFWSQHQSVVLPPPPPPVVDFDTHAVVALFAGVRPTGGYGIGIDSIVYTDASTLTVNATETAPGPGCLVPFVITYPFHLVLVPKEVATGSATASVTVEVFECS